ncbi:hypothetical protein HWI79_2254 [Cryptosporidium felis]|nr:hypothetical protein HWI79_2254 [Cryptosporidium felis]
MFFHELIIFTLLALNIGVFSMTDQFLGVDLQCNGRIIKKKLLLRDFIDQKGPFIELDSLCSSNDEVKVHIGESGSFSVSKLTSNIILSITIHEGKVMGVNLFKGGRTKDRNYLFQEIRIVNSNLISEIKVGEATNIKADSGKTTEKQQSFLRRYWWLIAIGFLSYSILTSDRSSMEPVENNPVVQENRTQKTRRSKAKNSQ